MTACVGATVDKGEEIELRFLIPAIQLTALEAAAARSKLTVPELLRSAIGTFLPSAAARPVNGGAAHPFGSTYFVEGLR